MSEKSPSSDHVDSDLFELPESSQAQGEDSPFSIDYRRLWAVTRKFSWLIVLYLIAGTVGAMVYLNNTIPIYRSFARLKIEQRVLDATPSFSGGAIEDLRGLEMLQTIQLGFVSRSLMLRIVEKTAIKDREDFRKDTDLEGEAVSSESFVGFLLSNTKVELIQGTRLMTVSFDHPDPQIAAEMVDTFVREYIALEGEQRLSAASVNLSYLLQEKKSLEEKLRTSEEQLSTYTRQLGSVSVDSELNIIAGQLIELNSRLTTAKAERLSLETDFEQIAGSRDDADRSAERAFPRFTNDPGLQRCGAFQWSLSKFFENRHPPCI
ncbi:MAG: GumC family protein [Chthoniobacterales bacterium]